jgi:hypothetical protein
MIPLLLTAAIAAIIAYDVFVAIIDPDARVFPSLGL